MQFKKKSLLFFVLFSFSLFGFSQVLIEGKVIDSESGVPLSDVEISATENKVLTKSDANGKFEVTQFGRYTFQKIGYKTEVVLIKKEGLSVIQLKINPSELSEVIVNSNQIPQKLRKATTTISVVSKADIERANNINFAPVLNRTPGIFMQSGALNTNRITIRGIGSRNLFGTSKIRAYFKDIPLTNGSGETTIEDFELASLARLEITKGAVSSIYGAGLGGTIHLIPENAYLSQSNINQELTVGSYGLFKGVTNFNFGNSKNSFRAVYSTTESDGYRENNNYSRQTLTLTTNHFISPKDNLSILASYVNLKAFIPSSINETTYLNDPESAAFTWKQSQGFEDSKRGLLGISWHHDYKDNLKQSTSVFGSFRSAYEPRPFDILEENTLAFGIRSRLLGQAQLFNHDLKWTFGGELFNDIYTSKTYENPYENFPQGTGSVEGEPLSDFKENRAYYNAFLETDYAISNKTTLSIGFNLNQTWYQLDDNFTVSESNPDQSGDFSFKTILSPKFRLSHVILENLSVFTSISHGFSPISLNETLLPDGQINTSLNPETGWNYEIGSRGEFLNNRLQFNVALYRLNIKNLLVARRTAEDQFVGINAGKTQHDGLELELNYNWLNEKPFTLSTFVNYTLNNFKFEEFIDDTADYSGNDLTGVPSDVFNAGIDFNSDLGIYGNLNHQFVGSMPITDSNSLYTDSYSLTNLKVGYRTNISKHLSFNVFFGINNIFDTKYASQILINATGFGGSAPRYYYPGNPTNHFTGFNLNYLF